MGWVVSIALSVILSALGLARAGGISAGELGQEPKPVEQQKPVAFSALFVKTDAMIPMRDGVKLHTEIYAPKSATEKLPLFLTRTPYGLGDDEAGYSHLLGLYREMFADGYIFVLQDIRGRYDSEGQFVMRRPPRDRADAKSIDEGTDTYDTIDWLLKNVPDNNGRVGMPGISYGGWLTAMALLDPHPALKAVSRQASPADMFLGDDFHHNGAFRLSYGFEYAAMMETGKKNFHSSSTSTTPSSGISRSGRFRMRTQTIFTETCRRGTTS